MSAERSSTNLFFDVLLPERGGDDDAQISNCKGSSCGTRHRTERSLVAKQEPPLGSHVVTPRRGYAHHGIYVGDGKVVHYAGLAHSLRRGPVEEISLARFTGGHAVYVRSDAPAKFDRREVIRRARSRVGEDQYRLLTNNCEHFCEWCLNDQQRSFQVEEWLAGPRRAIAGMASCVTKLLCLLQRFGLPTFHLGGFNNGTEGA